jgi:hypothetical protein
MSAYPVILFSYVVIPCNGEFFYNELTIGWTITLSTCNKCMELDLANVIGTEVVTYIFDSHMIFPAIILFLELSRNTELLI